LFDDVLDQIIWKLLDFPKNAFFG